METQPTPSTTSRLLKGSSVIFFFTIITSPLGYLIRMIFSRSLSIEEYGLIYAMLSFFALLTMVNDLGFGHAVSYFVPKFINQGKFKLGWLLYRYDQIIEVVTSFCIAGFLLLTSNFWVESFFKHESAYPLLWLFSLYLIGNGVISSIQKLLIGLQKEAQYSAIEFIRLGFTFLFSLGFFLYDVKNILWYASAFVAGYVLVAIVFLMYIQRYKSEPVPLVWKPKLVKKCFAYAVPTFFSTSLFILINYTDMIFLTAFQTIEQVGLYNIIFPIVSVATLLLEPMRKMIVPLVSELHEQKKFGEISVLVNQLLVGVPLASLYFTLFILIFPESVISLLFGYKWVSEAAHLLQIMSVGYLPLILMTYLTSVVNGLGRIKERLQMSGILAVVSIILGSFGAYFYGIAGVIFANITVYVLASVLLVGILRKDIQLQFPAWSYFGMGSLLLGGFIFRLVTDFVPITTTNIIVTGVVYTLCFSAFVFVTKIIDYSLFKQILKYHSPKISK